MIKKFSGMILSAGFGKRMLPLTKNLPKSLIEINGITLLANSINFLKDLGCDQIIINSHFEHLKIYEMINERKDKNLIKLIYEEEILDTGGGVKNAIPYFVYDDIIVINSDVFWINQNIDDVTLLIKNYFQFNFSQLLLVDQNNAFGLSKNNGDFSLQNNFVNRYNHGDKIIYYSGLQIINSNIFNNFSDKKFSFNLVWDSLIKEGKLCGKVMKSKWFHVGDIKGLSTARKLIA